MRDKILRDWFIKGELEMKQGNYFEAFIYLWISWVIGCKIYVSLNLYRDISKKNFTDREDVIDWCTNNPELIVQIIQQHKNSLAYLGKRKGDRYGDPIIDASLNLSRYFFILQKYFNNEHQYRRKKELATHFAELLNKIRNNLFHGDKTYNEESDLELIKSVLPVLYDFAKEVSKS
jgi:hypothetical protein